MSRPWSAVRTPSFWLLLAVTGSTGALLLLAGVFVGLTAPRSALVSLPLVAAYAIGWLVLIRWLDRLGHRPWWLVALALLWGATVSVGVGGGAGYTIDNLLGRLFTPDFASVWGAAVVAPPAEELAKVAGVVFLFLAARPHLRTVFAGAVYGAVIGVGFAAVEDLGYAVIAADETLPDHVGAALRMLALRFALPGAVGHPLFTAVAGAGVAYFVVRTDRTRTRRVAVLVGASALAWLTHAAVNSPVAVTVTEALDGLPGFSGFTGYLLVIGIPAAASIHWLVRFRRADAAALADRLGAGGAALATGAEAATFATLGGRGRAARAVGRAHGRSTAGVARRVQRSQLRLVDLPPELPVPPSPYGVGAPVGWPAPGWTIRRLTRRQRVAAELAEARVAFWELTGSPEVPAVVAGPAPVPVLLTRSAIGLAVLGLVLWPAALAAGLLVAWLLTVVARGRGPVARELWLATLAVALSAYPWLVDLLVRWIYPDLI
ncbi:PrsW family intramembrane metalloprotease [Micromonospora sp. NPDC050397]|uniref:PrsW family intramembrane metalloprotease n=1 Tax=Micromonospora sp. NPDC050397 TaxID=3364279 RepID=UPI003851294C